MLSVFARLVCTFLPTKLTSPTQPLTTAVLMGLTTLTALPAMASSTAPGPLSNTTLSVETPPNLRHATPTKLAKALAQAHDENLAERVDWRRLLYYPNVKKPFLNLYKHQDKKADVSRVINRFNPKDNQQRFFIHPQGGTDAQAELDAMLTAMFDPTGTGDTAAQCRFPARAAWLKSQLNLSDSDLPAVNCPRFDAWYQMINPKSASVIFANEYLDSLPSAFAHSFLRFDNQTNPYYLNYTPKVTEGESQLAFSYKSAIAGNAGEFSINQYAKGIQDYTQNQGRDVWEYRLNLSDAQVAQLARQVYEVKDQRLPYYLLDENCASEILVLLNTLLPTKDYLKGMQASVAPAQIMRRLAADGLIAESKFVPAAVTQAQAQRNAVNGLEHPHTNARPFDTDTLIASRNNPLLANPLGQVSIGYAHQEATGAQSALRSGYRVVYHDALDKPSGYPLGSQLSALSTAIRVTPDPLPGEDTVSLEHATLIKLRSFNPMNTAKAALHRHAWGLDIGLQQAYDSHRDDGRSHLVAYTGFEYGKSVAYGQAPASSGEIPPNICYALGNPAAEFGKGLAKGYRIGIGANIGCIQQLHDNLRGMVELSLPYWIGGDSKDERYWQPKLMLSSQYDFSRHHALRLSASREWLAGDKHDHVDDLMLSYLQYFE